MEKKISGWLIEWPNGKRGFCPNKGVLYAQLAEARRAQGAIVTAVCAPNVVPFRGNWRRSHGRRI